MKKPTYNLLNVLLLFFSLTSYAQEVSGVVLDDDGDPLIGANVLEQGTYNGTVTDLDGTFTLSVKS